MRLWDLKTGHCVYVLKTHTCADICFDDDKVITASFDNTLGMWDWKTGDVLQCFRGHTAAGNLEFKVHTLMILEVYVANLVNTSNSGSGGAGFKTCPSSWSLRQGTLLHFVSLHRGVYTAGG